MYLGISK